MGSKKEMITARSRTAGQAGVNAGDADAVQLNRAARRAKARQRATKGLSAALALGVVGSGLMLGGTAAHAGFGSAGSGGGGGGGGGGSDTGTPHLIVFDDASNQANPGQASIDRVNNMIKPGTYGITEPWWANGSLAATGATAQGHGAGNDNPVQRSCSAAIRNAEAAYPQDGPARVIAFGFATGQGMSGWGSNKPTFLGAVSASAFDNLQGWSSVQKAAAANAYVGAIPDNDPRVVCVATNSQSSYKLSIATDKSANVPAKAGSTVAVHDRVTLSTNGSQAENVTVVTTMKWRSPEGKVKQVSKNKAMANKGATNSPSFSPSDFGWHSWPSGKGWFDVSVAKQGAMEAAVSHAGENDARENWNTARDERVVKTLTSGNPKDEVKDNEVFASGMFYNAEVSAYTNGYDSQITLFDSILTDKVFIGAKDKDVASAAYVLDPEGNKVAGAEIKIDRAAAGKVTVSGAVKNIPDKFQSRAYTLVVPTYFLPTEADYSVKDDSSVCYTTNVNACLKGNSETVRKVTPKPDKVWVLDENGALVESDPGHTNNEGVDGMTFAPGSPIGAVVNGRIPANLAEPFEAYELVDDWTGSAKYVDFSDAKKAKVFLNGKDVTSQFDVTVSGTKTIAKAKAGSNFLKNSKGLKADAKVKLYIEGQFRNDYKTDGELEKLTNAGHEKWNNETIETNVPPVFTVTPKPDKVWVLDTEGGLREHDSEWTNSVGADEKVFLMNDAVGAVVNGKVPANMGTPFAKYSISDDWTKAADFVDFGDPAKAKVFLDKVDVTKDFDITVDGTVTTATAKAGSNFLKNSAGRKTDGVVKLIIEGQFRDDYDTNGEVVKLYNDGWEIWNDHKQETNTPPVYTWTPDPSKEVIGSEHESGNNTHDDINGMQVFPGQHLRYEIGVDLRVPGGTARGVKSLVVEDVHDPMFVPNKASVQFWDNRDPKNSKQIPRSQYKLAFNEETHSFTATFTQEWIDKNVNVEGANSEWLDQGWLTMTFDGKVRDEAAPGSTVKNQAFQIINDAKTATEVPVVEIPKVEPDKEDLNVDTLESIDGKTVVKGDHLLYRLTLDARVKQSELAYNVHKLGMVDDFDEEYLDLTVEGITVKEKATGKDVTGAFNIQIKDGKAYIFAKTVDTENAYGELIPGDPQPEDLETYSTAAIKPHEDAMIDQGLLGQEYYILMDTVVNKELNDYVIENQATQNIQNTWSQTKIVTNPLKEIDPSKDVVVSEETKDDSINEAEVKLYGDFNYRLNSSVIPANRAYKASSWTMSDTFDRVHDEFTGIWAIYADRDFYDGDTLLVKKGSLLQDSAGHESEALKGLFDVKFDGESYTLSVTATQKYLDLLNTRGDLEQAFSVYTKMIRIAPGEKIDNQVTEKYNDVDRESNIVWTSTPENPSILVEKYTLDEGWPKGDRDEPELAFGLTEKNLGKAPVAGENGEEPADTGIDYVKVGFFFENNGDVPLKDVTFVDQTLVDTFGSVNNITCEVPLAPEVEEALKPGTENPEIAAPELMNLAAGAEAEGAAEGEAEGEKPEAPEAPKFAQVTPDKITTLAVGERINCVGVLQDIEAKQFHSDEVTVTGKSVFTDKEVSDKDQWHAELAAPDAIDVEKFTLDEGWPKGDRDTSEEAYKLTAKEAKDGLKIGFKITNTGQRTLFDVKLTDQTHDTTTGQVKDITCEIPEGQKAGDPITLKAGGSIDCFGTLTDVKADSWHADTATATGKTKNGTVVQDQDPWFAKLGSPDKPVNPTPDPDPKKGAVTGEMVAPDAGIPAALWAGIAALLVAVAAAATYAVSRKRRAELLTAANADEVSVE